MPINYDSGIIREHIHVRNFAGLFDVSHMGQILITASKNNIKSLERYIPLVLENLKTNKSYYSFILNTKGGVIDDLIISKILYNNTECFFIVYNAGRKKEDEEIFKNILNQYTFLNNNSLIAIQGPESVNVLKFLNIASELFFMNSKVVKFQDNLIIVNRSGYTGEDGFEISVPNSIVLNFMNLVMKNTNAKLCGLGSRDSLRLEAGLSLYGNELNEDITPVDANLTWSIHQERLNDKNLNGHQILLNQVQTRSHKKKIGIKSLSKSILRSNMKLIDIDNKQIGIITSGGFSPTLNLSIGIGYLEKTSNDNRIYSLIRGNLEKLEIVNLPFIKNNYQRGKNE
jgi:aminomethyltransferase